MSSRKIKKKSIKNADIYVGVLPSEYYPEGVTSESINLYCVYIDNEVLRTPNGAPIYHKNDQPIRELTAELEYMDYLDVHKVSLYSLCCSQLDYVEKNPGSIDKKDLRESLLNDYALQTCAGPEVIDQMKYMQVIVNFLKEYGIKYPNLPQIPLGEAGLEMAGISESNNELDSELAAFYTLEGDKNFDRLVDLFFRFIQEFDVYQRTVLNVSVTLLNSITLPIMLASQAISPRELAAVYMFANAISDKVWGDSNRKEERDLYNEIQSAGECMHRYLALFTPTISKVEQLIAQGESKQLEFKSTLRWNLKTNQKDVVIEHAVLKEIVAYLNSDGGTLLVGVQDDGSILGIQADQFPTDDKYLLHFSNIFNERIGKRYADFVHWELIPVEEKKILQVKCEKSPEAVFLKNNGQEEFFIRTGPSTVQLSASQMLEYSKHHF